MTDRQPNLLLLFADLLAYPGDRLKITAAECFRHLKEFAPKAATDFEPFIDFLKQQQQPQIEEAYTATFDLQALCHPYVGYQLCGESQARTMFLMKLQEIYKKQNFSCDAELPDHLSVMLRFIASNDDTQGNSEIISDALLPALQKIIDGFEREDQPYRQLLHALQTWLMTQVKTELPETKSQKGAVHG